LETASSKKQSEIKRLFMRYFISEFTDNHKFMSVNAFNSSTDINALLRQVAVAFPESITSRDDRSYMLAKLTNIDRQNKEI
jgi:hypothetical protein